MKKTFIILVLFFLFALYPQLIFAASPTLISPPQNAIFTTTKPKLTWSKFSECEEKSCYKVEISQKNDFSDLSKSAYTNGVEDEDNERLLSYSPNLEEGTYYWHVKGKNNDGSWGDFSETRTFSVGKPTPQVLGATTTTQDLTIQATTNTLKDLEPLTLKVTAQNLTPNTKYYLKGAFYKEGSTNYFGLTQVNNTWTKNSSSYDLQPSFTTDSSGNWQSEINVRNDPSDSGYPGSGDYQLKVGRYTQDGDGPSWSNSLSINLDAKKMTAQALSQSSNQKTPEPVAATPDPAISANSVLGAKTDNAPSALGQPDQNIDYKLPDITAQGNGDGPIPSLDQKVLVAGQKTTNWWFISSGAILFALGGYHYWRSKKRFRVAT